MERKETSPPVQGGCIYRPLETTANLGIYAAETMPTGSGEALGYAVGQGRHSYDCGDSDGLLSDTMLRVPTRTEQLAH